MDNPFNTPISGSADWDTDISANFQAIERGYHVTERAGVDVATGQMLTLNSGGFFFPYNSASADIAPHALAYTAASSGESITALAWGIVRSMGINSVAVPGKTMFANGSGFLSVTTAGLPVGFGLTGYGLLFNPQRTVIAGGGGGGGYTPTYFTSSLAIAAVVGSLHTFTFSLGGLFGDNRRVRVNGNSASFAEVKFYADAGLTQLQYSTTSGGVSAVNSFTDRAGWPFDTNSGTLYGTLKVLSGDVSSSTINIQGSWRV